MWKYSFVAGCRRLDCGDPRLSWPADQLHRHPFHPERDTARSFLSLDHIWAQHSEVSKHQFPSDLSETKFFLLCPVTETTLIKVQKSSLLLAYEVNAVGPILVIKVKLTGSLLFSVSCCDGIDILHTGHYVSSNVESLDWFFWGQHMRPLLKVGGRSETGRGFSLVANMSARVSSIGDNGLGGWHSYRASKTALNQCKWAPRGSVAHPVPRFSISH